MTADLPKSLRMLAGTLRVPEALTTNGLRGRFGDPDGLDPSAGQVRRAVWADVSLLVVLLGAADDRHWTVVPVSVEPSGQDDDTLLLTPQRTTFGVDVTAWAGLRGRVPTGVLGRVIDAWDAEVTAWCAAPQTTPPPGTRRGRPADPYGADAAVRADLRDLLETLAEAPLVPVSTASDVDVAAAATRVGLPAVMTALDLPLPDALKIVRGKAAVTGEQAAALAHLFDATVDSVLDALNGLPARLAIELEQPRWRGVWRSWAARTQRAEDVVRLQVGTRVSALGYRQSGSAGTPEWTSRIEHWLADHDVEDLPDDA